jgi:hypothetical protein
MEDDAVVHASAEAERAGDRRNPNRATPDR